MAKSPRFSSYLFAAYAVSTALAAVSIAGCSGEAPKGQNPVNTTDPAGTGLSPQERMERINANPTLTPEQKQKMTERMQRRMSGGQQTP